MVTCVEKYQSSYFTTARDTITWMKLRQRALAVANKFRGSDDTCLGCESEAESQLHLCKCRYCRLHYWNFFFIFCHEIGLSIPRSKTVFLATGEIQNIKESGDLIGIFSIAWRCLWAAIVACRLDGALLDLRRAQIRALLMISTRLRAYGHECRTFCIERRYSGRKCVLPKDLRTKWKLITIEQNGSFRIHSKLEQAIRDALTRSNRI